MKKHLSYVCLLKQSVVIGLLAATTSLAHAAIIADFSGGDGTQSPDQFRGIAGDGWEGAWSSRNGSNSTNTFGVVSTTPFGPGMGNYLQVDYLKTANSGSNRTGVARQFLTSGQGSVSTSQAYSIAFDFRATTMTGFSSSGDQVAFSSEATTTIGTFGTAAPWSLLYRGDTGWIVTNGDGIGGVINLNFSTLGLTTMSVNTVYSIKVFIDPSQNGYDLTITTGGNTYRASELNNNQLLGFRTDATAASANVLQFRAIMDNSGDQLTFGLDNIAVVPEPNTVSALALGGLTVGTVMFLKRRTQAGHH